MLRAIISHRSRVDLISQVQRVVRFNSGPEAYKSNLHTSATSFQLRATRRCGTRGVVAQSVTVKRKCVSQPSTARAVRTVCACQTEQRLDTV